MNIDDAATWAKTHKAAAAAAGLTTAGLVLLLILRRRSAKNAAGQTGATIPADGTGNTLVPYGDATTPGYSGGGGGGSDGGSGQDLSSLIAAITGLTTTLTPPVGTDPVAVGGNLDTGGGFSTMFAAPNWVPRRLPVPISTVVPVTSRPSEATTTVTTRVAAPTKARYTAVRGDTVKAIAARYHITMTQFLTLNRLPQTTRTLTAGTSYRVQL